MTQEEKELLVLKDLSARMPYKVIGQYKERNFISDEILLEAVGISPGGWVVYCAKLGDSDCCVPIKYIKYYLRPMTDMTEEEKKILWDEFGVVYDTADKDIYNYDQAKGKYNMVIQADLVDLYDFLNSHFLDYRGLIPQGLALPAKEGMYKI